MPSTRQRRNNKAHLAAAAEAARIASEVNIPGAVWANIPSYRCHLPGLPNSYYEDELVVIRERTAALIERQTKELERRQHYVAEEHESGWIGVDE